MGMTILRDVLISKGKLEDLFEGTVPVTLWRALNRRARKGVFDFAETPTVLSNGRPRPADIRIECRDGVKWVSVKNRPRGLSVFDRRGVPKGKDWDYYQIPAGTVLPEGLVIVRDEYNTAMNAQHYTIAPAYDMPLQQFKLRLGQLASVLLKEAI